MINQDGKVIVALGEAKKHGRDLTVNPEWLEDILARLGELEAEKKRNANKTIVGRVEFAVVKDRSRAWLMVCKALDKTCPKWWDDGSQNTAQSACRAIAKLAEGATNAG